ncbi:hypothetical protein [Paracoccus marinaquae]|uniref:Flagellar assembly protein FliH/Type III secretion system HrpE domain-containing protein n=1 Tax=Paracoccus marinaquae TaxID=2841926 RepID=A0ABS6ADD2_9RHOB|nr:hypothetical protein [Paracoccus marinaquae]MBU3028610.1 hypothetical protein [Paracoccus marinaquae]
MTFALFKLESFSATQPGLAAGTVYGPDDLDQAYARGLTEGLARREDEQMRNLAAGLERLGHALIDDSARRAALREEAVTALAPVLDAIVGSLTPAGESQRLETALREELSRLARLATPLRARIACGPRLRGLVERCLAAEGIDGVEVEDIDSDRISLSLQGGRIELSPRQITEDIRALLAELKEDKPTWTR